MTEIKRDIKTTMQALYPEAIAQAETPQCWSHSEMRMRRLDNITGAIQAFCNDGGEAADIISAVAEGLKHRYEDPTEALLSLTLAKLALERLDVGYQVDAKEELEALEAQIYRSEKRLP